MGLWSRPWMLHGSIGSKMPSNYRTWIQAPSSYKSYTTDSRKSSLSRYRWHYFQRLHIFIILLCGNLTQAFPNGTFCIFKCKSSSGWAFPLLAGTISAANIHVLTYLSLQLFSYKSYRWQEISSSFVRQDASWARIFQTSCCYHTQTDTTPWSFHTFKAGVRDTHHKWNPLLARRHNLGIEQKTLRQKGSPLGPQLRLSWTTNWRCTSHKDIWNPRISPNNFCKTPCDN